MQSSEYSQVNADEWMQTIGGSVALLLSRIHRSLMGLQGRRWNFQYCKKLVLAWKELVRGRRSSSEAEGAHQRQKELVGGGALEQMEQTVNRVSKRQRQSRRVELVKVVGSVRTCCKQMKHWRRRDVSEAVACIRGAWRQTKLTEPEVSTKCRRQSKRSELVRTGWNLSGVTSATCRT
jgi:hypothetical protein